MEEITTSLFVKTLSEIMYNTLLVYHKKNYWEKTHKVKIVSKINYI